MFIKKGATLSFSFLPNTWVWEEAQHVSVVDVVWNTFQLLWEMITMCFLHFCYSWIFNNSHPTVLESFIFGVLELQLYVTELAMIPSLFFSFFFFLKQCSCIVCFLPQTNYFYYPSTYKITQINWCWFCLHKACIMRDCEETKTTIIQTFPYSSKK